MEREELKSRFEATTYRATDPQGRVQELRIGRTHPGIDATIGNRAWAFLTACNPDAENATPEQNAHAMRRLARCVGHSAWCAESVADEDGMREPAYLVPGLSRDAALALGRRFGQVAIVFGAPGGPARLLWC